MVRPLSVISIRTTVALLSVLVFMPQPSIADAKRVGPVKVELVSEREEISGGEPFEIGLRILPDPEWHVYWKNPGDAGLPPALKWKMPVGFTVSEIHYPTPSLIPAGPLAAYGYYGEALYPVTVTPPRDLRVGDTIRIELNAQWLVCKEECLPGSAFVSVSLPVVGSETTQPSLSFDLFSKTRAKIPSALPDEWHARAAVQTHKIELQIAPQLEFSDSVRFEFFAADKAVIEYSALQNLLRDDGYKLELVRSPYSIKAPDSISGVLAIFDGSDSNYYEINLPVDSLESSVTSTIEANTGLWLALLLAFVGGIILNLMPCVLPVLSLKVLGLVERAGESRKSLLWHGLAFTFGIVATFWALVIVMFILQAGGAELGWGFQLQSPVFVLIMAGFIFLMALNMFGVFEIGFLASRGVPAGQSKGGFSNAFVSGITATLLATPCTAPFMGTALGYSLTQPPMVSLLIYTSLGVGMAAPYLMLALLPSLLRFVPKPGRWMETLKQSLGFLLMATVIWLAWILSSQSGTFGLIILLGVLLTLAIAGWIYGRWSIASKMSAVIVSRMAAAFLIAGSVIVGSLVLESNSLTPATTIDDSLGRNVWQTFSVERLDSLRLHGQPVFVDFTAAWCLSCQVNERVALVTDEVQSRFKSLNVTLLKADWTLRSPEIARALANYGRNSVPLYVLYGPHEEEPTFLPEILTPGIVLDALHQIDKTKDQ